MTIEINHPLYGYPFAWGKEKAVGIAEWRIGLEGAIVQIRIVQKYHSRITKKHPNPTEKDGSPIYPTTYCINKEETLKYPQKMAGDGKTVLRVIPMRVLYPKKFDLGAAYYPPKQVIEQPKQQEVEQGKLL